MNSEEQAKLLNDLNEAFNKTATSTNANTFKPKVSRKQQVLEMALLLNRAA